MKAVLSFDPHRRPEQQAFVRDRATVLHEFGDRVWVTMADEMAARFADQGIHVQPQDAADLIELPAIVFDPEAHEPEPPPDLTAAAPAGGAAGYYLVQFAVAPEADWVRAIEELGGVFVEDVPIHAAAFRLTAGQAAGVRELGDFVSWVGPFHPAYALSHRLAGRDAPFSAEDLHTLQPSPDGFVETADGAVRVAFFADLAVADMRPAVEAAGARVVDDTGFDLIVNLPVARVADLLRIPGVRSLEIHRPPNFENQRAGIIMGASEVRSFGQVNFVVNLDGSGEIAGIFDSGLDSGTIPTIHTDFNDALGASRVISIDNLNPPPVTSVDFLAHGTHVAGSIAGDGRNAPPPDAAHPNNAVPRGLAPASRIVFTSANNYNAPPPPPTPPAPCGVKHSPPRFPLNFSRFMQAFENHYASGARVHSNSWGGEGPNTYDNTSGQIDRFAFLKPDTTVLFAVGNDEEDKNDDTFLDQTFLGGEVTTKNILVIGATENATALDGDSRNYQTRATVCNRYGTKAASAVRAAASAATAFSTSDNADHVAMFSSRGRVVNPASAARRRVKPDLVAPGTNILSTLATVASVSPSIRQCCPAIANPPGIPNPGIPSTAPATRYVVFAGTSMATPLTAGACLLVRQYYRQKFGLLRRPLLLERENALVDLPAVVAQSSGGVMAWIQRDTGAGQNHLVAARYSRQLVRATSVVQIATNVGDHPAVALARSADNTVVLYRDSGNVLRLLLRDPALAAVGPFGTAGTVTLAPNSRPEDERRPSIAVQGNQVAVVWFETATDNLRFQRFRADTGAPLDAAAKVIGTGTHTSPHPCVLHNGAHWAVFWGAAAGGNFHLMLRFVDNAGALEGGGPRTLLTQAQAIREPHPTWDPGQSRFLVAFVSEAAAPNRGVRTVRVNADGTLFGAPATSVALATEASRRPRTGLHPDGGFVLLWEDNSQRASHDVYFALLDAGGAPRAIDRMQISDTPNDTGGFSALVDADGLAVLWQSDDEINSDLKGVYALAVTKDGVYQAQADPSTPLLVEQFYVTRTLVDHGDTALVATAMAWAGGEYFLLRVLLAAGQHDLYVVRTNADGRPDTALALDGAVRFDRSIGYDAVTVLWTGSQLIAAASFGADSRVYLLDRDGRLVGTFGTAGVLTLTEPSTDQISLQVAQRGTGPSLRVLVAYGRAAGAPPHTIRYTVRNGAGVVAGAGTVAPRDLVPAAGTARQGWFHLLDTESPARLIVVWHIQVAARMVARVNRFQLSGLPQIGVGPFGLSGAAGDSQNAVIAPRPVTFAPAFPITGADTVNSRRREFGAAWQHRPTAGNWEIRFSALRRTGEPDAARRDIIVAQKATHHATEPQLVWHTDGYGVAWLEQPVVGGGQQLFFTILDPNGARPNLAVRGAAAAPATDFPVSLASADVKRFQLVWTGSTFRITWTEVEAGRLRQKQRALSVPRVAGSPRYDAPFQQPSAALVRATLINGATNLRNTALPNFGNDVNDGYGWGRINLRQSLAPAPPVTYHVRDDGVVAPGRTVTYEFELPPATQLLRVTLTWTDPPGNNLVNHLHLRVKTPVGQVFHGNHWQPAVGRQHLSDPITGPPPPFEDIHNVQQVVVAGPPALPAGSYVVEVIGGVFGASAFQQSPGQPFALVFVGSGAELRTTAAAVGGPVPFY